MEIREEHWDSIRKFFGHVSHVTASLVRSTPYLAFATVNEDGSPHVTPMGSLLLGPDKKGFYFEEFARRMPANLEREQRVCVLIVNTSMWFWIKSLLLGRMDSPPAIRLIGTAGERREATPEEIKAFHQSIRPYRMFKGYKLLWRDVSHVRDIHFQSFEPVRMGPLKALETV